MCEGKMEIQKERACRDSICVIGYIAIFSKHGLCSHYRLSFMEIFSSEGEWQCCNHVHSSLKKKTFSTEILGLSNNFIICCQCLNGAQNFKQQMPTYLRRLYQKKGESKKLEWMISMHEEYTASVASIRTHSTIPYSTVCALLYVTGKKMRPMLCEMLSIM